MRLFVNKDRETKFLEWLGGDFGIEQGFESVGIKKVYAEGRRVVHGESVWRVNFLLFENSK